jgi:hypothetical protein
VVHGGPALLHAHLQLLPKQALAGALTGTVIDSGDGCTHVIPVSDGYVIASAIQSIPIAGRDITSLVQQLMRCARACACACLIMTPSYSTLSMPQERATARALHASICCVYHCVVHACRLQCSADSPVLAAESPLMAGGIFV